MEMKIKFGHEKGPANHFEFEDNNKKLQPSLKRSKNIGESGVNLNKKSIKKILETAETLFKNHLKTENGHQKDFLKESLFFPKVFLNSCFKFKSKT